MLLHGAPGPEAPAADRDLHLVEMPGVAPAGLPTPKASSDHGTGLP